MLACTSQGHYQVESSDFYHSPFKAIFSLAVLWVGVGGSLCCMDARDNAAGGGSGSSAKEMGD